MRIVDTYVVALQYVREDGRLDTVMMSGMHAINYGQASKFITDYPSRDEAMQGAVKAGLSMVGQNALLDFSSRVVGFTLIKRDFGVTSS